MRLGSMKGMMLRQQWVCWGAWMVFVCFPLTGFAIDGDKESSFSAALYQEGDYYRAVTEILREQFHNPKKLKDRALNLRLIRSYFHLKDDVRLKTAVSQILADPSPLAGGEKEEIAAYLLLTHLKRDQESAAERVWDRYLKGGEIPLFPLFSEVKGTVDPDRAGLYSAFLPGAGFLLTESYGKAAGSFLLNAVFIAGTYHAYHKGLYGVAGLLFFFEIGWYKGGINAAVESAEQFNQKRVEEVQQRWIELHFTF